MKPDLIWSGGANSFHHGTVCASLTYQIGHRCPTFNWRPTPLAATALGPTTTVNGSMAPGCQRSARGIAYKELYPIVLACHLWGPLWCRQRIESLCDSEYEGWSGPKLISDIMQLTYDVTKLTYDVYAVHICHFAIQIRCYAVHC